MLRVSRRVAACLSILASAQAAVDVNPATAPRMELDRKSTRLNSSHLVISYAVFCLKKKKTRHDKRTATAGVPIQYTVLAPMKVMAYIMHPACVTHMLTTLWQCESKC